MDITRREKMKTGLLVSGILIFIISLISHLCIAMAIREGEEVEYNIFSWLLPLSGSICVIFGLSL
jgi:hypothetical protein